MRLSVKSIVVCHEYQVSVWRVRVSWLLKHVCSQPAGHSPFSFSDCALASSMSCCCAALSVCRTHVVSDLCCTVCSAAFVGKGSHRSPTLSCNCHCGSVHGRASQGQFIAAVMISYPTQSCSNVWIVTGLTQRIYFHIPGVQNCLRQFCLLVPGYHCKH